MIEFPNMYCNVFIDLLTMKAQKTLLKLIFTRKFE